MSETLSLAPTNRATCKHCGKTIAKDSERYAHTVPGTGDYDGMITRYYHPRCALELDPKGLARALRDSELAFADRAALEREVKKVLQRLERGSGVDNDDQLPLQHSAEGLPRARVVVAPEYYFDPIASFLIPVAPQRRWKSPKRDYLFVHASTVAHEVGVNDPAVPLLTGVYVARSLEENPTDLFLKLSAWKQLGISVPVLWIAGRSKKQELAMRLRLEAVGFPPDEAIAFQSNAINKESMDAFVRCLDEHFPEPAAHRETRTLMRRAATTLLTFVKEERFEPASWVLRSMLAAYKGTEEYEARDTLVRAAFGGEEDAWKRADALLMPEPLTEEEVAAIEQCTQAEQSKEYAKRLLRCVRSKEPKTTAKKTKKKSA